jgi:hypothetical protein
MIKDTPMHIAIFADTHSQSFSRLHQALALADVAHPPEVHSDVGQFCQCFRSVAYHPDVVIMMPSCVEELKRLADDRDLFANSRTILILPDQESSVVSVGHLFHPRFIAFGDEDFQDLAAVLRHLCTHRQGRPDGQIQLESDSY